MRALDSIKLASIVMKNAVELKATAVDLFRSGAYSQSHASDYYLLKVIPAEGSAYTVINDDEMEAFSGECFLADVAVKITEKGVEFENSQTGEKLVVDGFDFEVGLGDVRESQRAV